jgi:hypothetical protein
VLLQNISLVIPIDLVNFDFPRMLIALVENWIVRFLVILLYSTFVVWISQTHLCSAFATCLVPVHVMHLSLGAMLSSASGARQVAHSLLHPTQIPPSGLVSL